MANRMHSHSNSGLFYVETYGDAILAHRQLGVAEASMLVCRQNDGDWSDAPTPDLVVSVLRRGAAKATVDLGAGKFRSTRSKGQIVLVSPGAGSTIIAQGQHEILALDVRYSRLRELAPELCLPEKGDFGALHADFITDPFLAVLIENIWSASSESDRDDAFIEVALSMVAAALSRICKKVPVASAVGGLSPWQLRTAIDRISASPNYKVSLADIAATVRLSPFHFARAFKKSTGAAPHEYLVQCRMERACALLERPEATITEIALDVGYETPQSFTRAFVRKMGVTPSTWRRGR